MGVRGGRSHPPTLIRLVERTLREECRINRGEKILVAASGGSDSTALLHTLSILAPKMGFTLAAHGVDHGLRSEAEGELDLAEAHAGRLGVPFERTVVSCVPGGNLQARARELRREALERAALSSGAARIATAHHADDRAETVLIRLLHGASPRALAVLPASDGHWIRPLLRARKADVIAHVRRHCLDYASDPSNENRRFLRVRVRMELLPLLKDLSPGIVDHLTALADEMSSAPLAELMDAAGRPVRLRRAQAAELRRAFGLGRAVTIRMSGGRELAVYPAASKNAPSDGRTPPPSEKKGGAKPRKSG